MTKRIIYIIFNFIFLFSCNANEVNFTEIIEESIPNYNIQVIREGFFLRTDEKSFLVLSENPKRKYNQNSITIHDSRVLQVSSEGSIEKNYKINFGTTEYNDYIRPLITSVQKEIPNWNKYTAIFDFNGNGLDEIFTLALVGPGMEFAVYEFNGEAFERTLDDTRFLGFYIRDIEFLHNGTERKFIITRIVNHNEQFDTYIWESATQKYVLVE